MLPDNIRSTWDIGLKKTIKHKYQHINVYYTSVVDRKLKDKITEHLIVAETHKANNIWMYLHVHVFLLFFFILCKSHYFYSSWLFPTKLCRGLKGIVFFFFFH